MIKHTKYIREEEEYDCPAKNNAQSPCYCGARTQDYNDLNDAKEIDYLTWFHQEADFGPAHEDVMCWIQEKFERETGKKVPKGWKYE